MNFFQLAWNLEEEEAERESKEDIEKGDHSAMRNRFTSHQLNALLHFHKTHRMSINDLDFESFLSVKGS